MGYAFTLANMGSNDAIDSDANPATGRTGIVDVATDNYAGRRPGAQRVDRQLCLDRRELRRLPGSRRARPAQRARPARDCTTGAILATTYTDTQGGYLFDDVAPGTYCVDIDETTLPPGVTQSPYTLPGADFGNQNHGGNGYPVILPPGGENLTADFGYNCNPPPCVDGNPTDLHRRHGRPGLDRLRRRRRAGS